MTSRVWQRASHANIRLGERPMWWPRRGHLERTELLGDRERRNSHTVLEFPGTERLSSWNLKTRGVPAPESKDKPLFPSYKCVPGHLSQISYVVYQLYSQLALPNVGPTGAIPAAWMSTFSLGAYVTELQPSHLLHGYNNRSSWEFPGGLVVRILHFHHCSPGSIPNLGTEILHQAMEVAKKVK